MVNYYKAPYILILMLYWSIKTHIEILFSKRQYKNIIKELNIDFPKKILDVGGSTGLLAEQINKKTSIEHDYTIIDVNKKALEKGKKIIQI